MKCYNGLGQIELCENFFQVFLVAQLFGQYWQYSQLDVFITWSLCKILGLPSCS